jgi:hypothetical protein
MSAKPPGQPRTSARGRLLSVAVALGAFAPLGAPCQEAKPTGGATRSAWYMYFGDHPISPLWSVHLEGQFRREDLGQRWEQLLIRPGVGYSLGHGVSSLVAYTYFRNYPFEGGTLGGPTTTGPQPEHRIFEELKVKHRFIGSGAKAVTLSHRFRAEQRFRGTSTVGVGTTDWNFAQRARYRLTADIPLRWNTGGARPDYVSLYDELFVNFGSHGGSHALNQNRTYGSLGWNLNPDFKVELGYLFQYTPQPNGVVGVGNHALQVSIYSTAPFRRGARKKK